MDDDDVLAQLISFTGATPERAAQYLQLADNNLEAAASLYFESGGVDMGAPVTRAEPVSATSQPNANRDRPIVIDSDNEDEGENTSSLRGSGGTEDDEAMARRLQEEMYGSGGPAEVRAPVARTTQMLAAPDMDWRNDPDEMNAAIAEQMLARRRQQASRPGIFNQQAPSPSIWEEADPAAPSLAPPTDTSSRRRVLARSTGGASETDSKASMLAEMYRPPFDLISPIVSWDGIRAAGKEEEKWILVNVQDAHIFDCQVLNRDVWKHPQIRETVRENFVFKQYSKDDAAADSYVRYYFQVKDSMDAYPHIAIVDPRTGELMKSWSGLPAPKPAEFLTQLHEFLDRYSLSEDRRNPVATRKKEVRRNMDVGKLSEQEMLDLAMKNSLAARGSGPRGDDDPDVLTRSNNATAAAAAATSAKGKARAPNANGIASPLADADAVASTGDTAGGTTSAAPPSLFSAISGNAPHTEPAATAPNTTRIQFRHPGGRVIRRFALQDRVRRIYEWLKADRAALGDGATDRAAGGELELVFMGRNLIGGLDETIEQAGLKNGSVMVEFVE